MPKSSCVWEHHKLMQGMNHCMLKSIWENSEESDLRTGGKELSNWVHNLVLQDHPEGCNKNQDHFKDHEFVIVE